MALIDDATLVVGAGNYFKADVDTAQPDDLATTPYTGWDNIGHTSLTDILAFSSDGGEKSVLGTLQNSSLRTVYSKRTEALAINLQQFDEDSLKLYYGSNAVDVSGGTGQAWVGNPTNPQPTEAAFLAVYVDGENYFGLYMPKCSIFRGDDVSVDDTENFVSLPLSITPLQSGTNTWTYALTPLGTVGGTGG